MRVLSDVERKAGTGRRMHCRPCRLRQTRSRRRVSPAATPPSASSWSSSTSAAPAMRFPTSPAARGTAGPALEGFGRRSYIAGRFPNDARRAHALAGRSSRHEARHPDARPRRVARRRAPHGRFPVHAPMSGQLQSVLHPAGPDAAIISQFALGDVRRRRADLHRRDGAAGARRAGARRGQVRPLRWIAGAGIAFPVVVLSALLAWSTWRSAQLTPQSSQGVAGHLRHRQDVVVGGALPRPGQRARNRLAPTKSASRPGARSTWR